MCGEARLKVLSKNPIKPECLCPVYKNENEIVDRLLSVSSVTPSPNSKEEIERITNE